MARVKIVTQCREHRRSFGNKYSGIYSIPRGATKLPRWLRMNVSNRIRGWLGVNNPESVRNHPSRGTVVATDATRNSNPTNRRSDTNCGGKGSPVAKCECPFCTRSLSLGIVADSIPMPLTQSIVLANGSLDRNGDMGRSGNGH